MRRYIQTGNGKCNLGNRALSVECYHGGDLEWIRDVLEHFDTEDTIRFFQSIGLMVKEKNGYLYPVCEQAAAVLDVLRYELQALGVEIQYQCKITKVERLTGCSAVELEERCFPTLAAVDVVAVDTDGTLIAAAWESGMDNGVRFDDTRMLKNEMEQEE